MSDQAGESRYDQVPYDSKPRYATHPDCLATLATLYGMRPAPPDRCRYLEIGCSTGGNLLPMAEALPRSRFVGIDLSAAQIDAGRRVAAALGLDNLRLEPKSLLDLDEDFGPFDYVVAHGVYSWVPAVVRDGLLRACQRLLAPQGVAYVSYNALPGWYLRAPVRDMMTFHVRDAIAPNDKVRQARELLEFVALSSSGSQNAWAALLREEAEVIRPEGDYYVYHEHLEPDNFPVYFEQFIAHAARHGLQFLSEASQQTNLSGCSAEERELLLRLAPDPLRLEQYLDFFRGRRFRRSLLIRDTIGLNRTPRMDVVRGMRVCGAARPLAETPDVSSAVVETYRNEDGIDVSTNVPIVKAALQILFEAWPRAFAMSELLHLIRERLGDSGPIITDDYGEQILTRAIVELFGSNLVSLHLHVPAFVVQPGERPEATRLTQLQGRTNAVITNRRHRQVNLCELERSVLALLDGRRERAALTELLTAAVCSGELDLRQHGEQLKDEGAVREVWHQELEPILCRLGQAALLIH